MSIRVQNTDVFTIDIGHGDPILFLHGNPDTSDIWTDVIARLRTSHRCLALDLPGFGRTHAPSDFDYRVENLGRFVHEVLQGLGFSMPVTLVAHDIGGAFATAFASQHPEKVRRLVAINHPFFIARYRWHIWARIWRVPGVGELSMATLTWPAFRWLVRQGSRKLSDEQIRGMYSSLTPHWKRMALRFYRALDPQEFATWHPRLLAATAQIPTLVLWGEYDPFIPAWVPDHFGARRVRRFEASGHWAPAEIPDLVSAQIAGFLAE